MVAKINLNLNLNLIYHAGAMETLVGLYEIVDFSKITKDSTNLHDNTPPTLFAG